MVVAVSTGQRAQRRCLASLFVAKRCLATARVNRRKNQAQCGSFPIDFWHGDGFGAFRIHGVPDVLLPSFRDLRCWSERCERSATLRPITGRLAFRQVGSRWWGRAFSPLIRFYLSCLDALTRMGMGRIVAPFYPYLVVEIRSSPS